MFNKSNNPKLKQVSTVDTNGMANTTMNTTEYNPRFTTYNNNQYLLYVDNNNRFMMGKRELPDGDWNTSYIGVKSKTREPHWMGSMEIGPKGHIFVTFNNRSDKLKWKKSKYPEDITVWEENKTYMTEKNEDKANHDQFFRLNNGDLIFGFRDGGSGYGDWMLNKWSIEKNSWEALHHPLISGKDKSVNAYVWNPIQSNDGTIHLFWTWRASPDASSNHNILYAQSKDNGKTWLKSNGNKYNLPINKDNAEVVDNISQNSGLHNHGWSSFDKKTHEPYVVYTKNDNEDNTQIILTHLNKNRKWEIEQVTNRNSNANIAGGTPIDYDLARPGVVVGENGKTHILVRDRRNSSFPWLIERKNKDSKWQTSIVNFEPLNYSGIHIDQHNWIKNDILSFISMSNTVGNVAGLKNVSKPVKVIDLNLENRLASPILRETRPLKEYINVKSYNIAAELNTESDNSKIINGISLNPLDLPGWPISSKTTYYINSSVEEGRLELINRYISNYEGESNNLIIGKNKLHESNMIHQIGWQKMNFDNWKPYYDSVLVVLRLKEISNIETSPINRINIDIGMENPYNYIEELINN